MVGRKGRVKQMREEKERRTNENGKKRGVGVSYWLLPAMVCVHVMSCWIANAVCLCNLQSSAEEINEMSSCSIQSCSSTPPPVWLVTESCLPVSHD